MADARSPSRNRRFGEKQMGRKFVVFVGDCSQAGEVIANKPITPLWVLVGFVDTLLRSYGQVVFCNNPVTGLLIMIALFISGPFAALVGLVAATIAIFTAWLLDQSPNAVRGGVFSYNAVLVGQLTAVLFPEMTIVDWIFMVFGAIFSVYFTSSFAALFGSISKHPMPALTVPFVAAQVLVCLSAASPGALYLKTPLPNLSGNIPGSALSNNSLLGGDSSTNTSVQQALVAATDLASTTNDLPDSIVFNNGDGIVAMNASMNSIPNPTTVNIETLDWGEVFTGVLKSIGQAYGQEHLPGSLLMYLGVVISSPTTALMCLFGSTVSTLVGAVLCPGPAESLYAGVWGYNGLLTAAALGGFALVLTPQSAALALMGALLTAVVHFALLASFLRAGVPLLTLPFNLAALLLLCATARGGGSLVRPPALTYPEKHRRDWAAARHSKRSRNLSSPSDLSSPDDEVDKKEQFRKLEII
ncbi:hypothetical protein R5R35_001729 [Gryllus longicercus]|uniref:Urea transporter n=1 Tax=Gryllus longicercus TaxID=2509291 RepID=A0AAN9WL11_9ORTH